MQLRGVKSIFRNMPEVHRVPFLLVSNNYPTRVPLAQNISQVRIGERWHYFVRFVETFLWSDAQRLHASCFYGFATRIGIFHALAGVSGNPHHALCLPKPRRCASFSSRVKGMPSSSARRFQAR